MRNINAHSRYEIEGKTLLYISQGWMPPNLKVGERITFTSAMNDSPGIHDLNLSLDRSIMIVDTISRIKTGFMVEVSLDADAMPATKRVIDGFVRKNY
ncbi:MAG TPA: hypothetical protein VGK47_06315 [Nitrososphaeraceae archaeon]